MKKSEKKDTKPAKIKKDRQTFSKGRNSIIGFFKELKRVRWPNASVAWKTFWTAIIFIAIASIVLFLITLGFTTLWDKWGVGL